MKTYFTYIMSNPKRSVLYTGVTNSLETRVLQHKQKEKIQCFTARYNCTSLVYFEATSDVTAAIYREKQIKGWKRCKKDRLIRYMNPELKDLAAGWYQ